MDLNEAIVWLLANRGPLRIKRRSVPIGTDPYSRFRTVFVAISGDLKAKDENMEKAVVNLRLAAEALHEQDSERQRGSVYRKR